MGEALYFCEKTTKLYACRFISHGNGFCHWGKSNLRKIKRFRQRGKPNLSARKRQNFICVIKNIVDSISPNGGNRFYEKYSLSPLFKGVWQCFYNIETYNYAASALCDVYFTVIFPQAFVKFRFLFQFHRVGT